MKGEFPLEGLKILPNENGKKFIELTPLQQGKIEDFQVTVYIIQPPTPDKVKFDIFDRVNRSATKLNHQEMRNALHQGKSTILLNELAESDEFKKATGFSVKSKRMKDRYVILRFLSFFMYYKKWEELNEIEYKGNIDDFLEKTMEIINEFDDKRICELKSIFLTSMRNSFNILGEDAFRFNNINDARRNPINMALFESLAFFFAHSKIREFLGNENFCSTLIQHRKRLDLCSFSIG